MRDLARNDRLPGLPDVVFIGPTKSGTTWIDAYLRHRGDVALPRDTKETFFFDKAHAKGLDWYRAQFDAAPGRLCVEVAPSLFHKPEAARRLARDLPGVRVVCTVRDPYDRAVSHYFHYRKAGDPRRSLSEMARLRPDLIEASLYHRGARVWEDLLGADRVSYLFYDDMRRDPDRFCRQLCAALGLDYIAPPDALMGRPVNAASIPKHPWLARLARGLSDRLRRNGGNRLVNAAKSPRLKRLLFAGGGDLGEERDQIRAEAPQLRSEISEDLARFTEMIAARSGAAAADQR